MADHKATGKEGKVYLIGAGPGDPELITVKGKKLIESADCIIYDFLASPYLLSNDREAERIYVGKTGSSHTFEQEEINKMLVEKARQGKIVARLKGGDPFIFGRGGEEALELVKAGIEFDVVPGVSSAYSAPAYAGIPVTHRGLTSTVAFITGHEDPAKQKSDIDWEKLATGIGTLVFLMGVKNLPRIADNLIRYGRSPDTEAAIVRWGTTARQQTITGKLHNIAGLAEKAGFKSPAIIVVGEVVSLRDTLAWFDKKPLFGRRVIVTRTREQASSLSEHLLRAGAEVLEIPTIQIIDPETFHSLDESIKKLQENYYHWVIFTSPNGVRKFFTHLTGAGLDSRTLAGARLAVIGPATAEELKKHGLRADKIPAQFRAEGIIEALGDIKGQNILLARAEQARDILPDTLAGSANVVDIAVAYRTIKPEASRTKLAEALDSGTIDLVTFTSSSTAENFAALLEGRKLDKSTLKCASIGPITSDRARELGFNIDMEAAAYTIDGLVAAIIEYYKNDSIK